MGKPGNVGITRIIKAFGFSMRGLLASWRHEAAFRQELLLCVVLIPTAFWLAQSTMQLVFMLATLFVVLITEILNSAVEAVVDRISDEHHHLAGRAKDMGSAAVFLSLAMVLVTWTLILLDNYSLFEL